MSARPLAEIGKLVLVLCLFGLGVFIIVAVIVRYGLWEFGVATAVEQTFTAALGSLKITNPYVAALAIASALPFTWPVIRSFLWSAQDDLARAAEAPTFAFLTWFPEWTLFKLVWLLVVLTAFFIGFYKLYDWLGGALGLLK